MIERFRERRNPEPLDIIQVDGRWGQVKGNSQPTTIKWLDDNSFENIDLGKYRKIEQFSGITVKKMRDEFTETELENVWWGSEQEKHPHLKLLVTVFGRYVKDPTK